MVFTIRQSVFRCPAFGDCLIESDNERMNFKPPIIVMRCQQITKSAKLHLYEARQWARCRSNDEMGVTEFHRLRLIK